MMNPESHSKEKKGHTHGEASAAHDVKADKKDTKSSDAVMQIKESEYQKLVEEAASYKEKYMRLVAEFDNARKRMERDKVEFIKFANEGLIEQFLEILDDLERTVAAAQANHNDYKSFLKGIELVMAHVNEMLKKNGVKPIETKGKIFDPRSHEALMQEEKEGVLEGTIIEEFQKGYLLGDRVVRTAKVKVAKCKSANTHQDKDP